jgi:hypothetical protein
MMKIASLERFACLAVTVLFVVAVFSNLSLGQNVQINGAFHGVITDATRAVVPGAEIEVKNLASGQIRKATTDRAGFYTITQLAPGHYSVSVSKPGFATATQPDVELQVNQDLEADYTLTVGQVTQRVEVTAAPLMLQTSSATLGQVVGSQEVVDLPLNGRQFTSLILLTPGAAPKEGGQQSFYQIAIGGGGLSPATNGQQGAQNTFTLDGVLNNHFFIQAWAISPPPDAIEEFNVQSHITDAQFSISSGANVNLVTKSGGPHVHGNAWEFIRNDDLDAANFFDNFANEPKPPYRQNQYGVTIGGPVVLPNYDGRKKQTYFFGYWEGYRSAQSFTEFANVPTAAELGGNFSDILTTTQSETDPLGRPIINGQIYNPYTTRQVTAGAVDPVTGLVAQSTGLVREPFAGNVIPQNMLTSQALTYLHAFYPSSNFGPGGNNFPNFASTSAQTITSDQFGVGLDHTFANSDTLAGKFYYSQPNQIYPNALLLGAETNENHARVISLAYTHVFNPTLLASIHYGYSHLYYEYTTEPGGTALSDATNAEGFLPVQAGIALVPQISIGPRLSATDQFAIPQGPMRTQELTVDLQKTHGSHTLSTGLLYMHVHGYDNGWGTTFGFDQYPTSQLSAGNVNQLTSGDGLASMLLNLPTAITGFYGITGADIRTHWLGAYAQDKYQVSKKLNLQIGLRWDFQAPPHYLNNEFTLWNPSCPYGTYKTQAQIVAVEDECILMPVPFVQQPSAAYPIVPSWPVPDVRSTLLDPKYNGWQPRFGFAYKATPRTVVRGAFVIFDDHNQFDKMMQDPRGNWPFGATVYTGALNHGIPSAYYNSPPAASSFLTPTSVEFGNSADPRSKIPYTMEYNFGFERELSPNTTLSLQYAGSLSRHQWGTYAYNQPLPNELGPNAFPNGQPFPFLAGITEMDTTIFNANYNALQVKVDKRFSHGLTFLASYTYSKCLDVSSGDFAAWPQDTYNLDADYGPCEMNFPQMLSFSYSYQLPIGAGRPFAQNLGRAAGALIGGWNISGILSAYSGSPFEVDDPVDNANAGTTQRPDVVPGCQLKPAGFQQTVYQLYNPDCFVMSPPYTFGNLARNTLRGPDFRDFDFSLFKDFNFTESKKLQFRSEFFNIFNRANFSPPGGGPTGAFTQLGGGVYTSVDTPTFMQILGASSARQIQFALKLIF